MIFLTLLTAGYFLTRKHIDKLYFSPDTRYNVENFTGKTNFIHLKLDGHHALFKRGTKNTCMLVAHGNAGSFFDREYLFDKLKDYSGDIYIFEYSGFSGVVGEANISGIVDEFMFWYNYLSNTIKYKSIDLYGESIGGGIIVEACVKHSIMNINKIFLQSSFSSLKDIIYKMNYSMYLLYNFLLLDDLNTSARLEKINCNKIIIIHSPQDDLIDYSQARKNYHILKKLKKNVIFIKGTGSHNNTQFDLSSYKKNKTHK
jgi:esterase/lipase